MMNATSTSSTEKPPCARRFLAVRGMAFAPQGRPKARIPPPRGAATWRSHERGGINLIQDRDTSGQPVDVDVELAIARRDGDPPAVAAAVGKEADRADAVADEIVLRGEEL